MKKSIILLGIAASLLAVSCSKMSPAGESGIKEKVSLGAVLEQQASETKTALSESTVVWSQGDQLSVLSTENAEGGDVFTLKDASAGQTSGEFEGDLTTADQYYALYPYDATAAFASGAVTFPVPATQEYVANGFANGANASIAPFTLATKDNLNFKNVFGVLKLSLKAGGEAITVNSIVVSDKSGKAMNGTASVNVSAVESGNPVATVSGTNAITLNCSSPVTVTSSTAVDFYFVVPAGVFANGFTVTANCTDGYRSVSTTKDNTIHRSYIREMPEIALPSTAETAVDLSVEGTANCYVVPTTTPKVYKFKATVKGNETTSSISPANAVLIWETDNTTTEITANSIVSTPVLEGEYVKFTATGKAGNALIAVRDADNNILWSWHIWCVSDLTDKGPFPNGDYCIDRELGALSGEEKNLLAAGLKYQWGRKDPFMGSTGFLSSSNTEFYAKYSNGYSFNIIKTACESVETSTATPATIYATGSDWLKNNVNNLWASIKTINDPCPMGYTVSPSEAWSGTTQGTWDKGCSLYYSSVYLGYLPATGNRDKSTGLPALVGKYYVYWTTVKGKYVYNQSNNVSFATDGTSYALSIRCCKEDTPSQSE